MANGPRLVMDNVMYHITTRGNQKQTTFIEDEDFEEYLDRVRRYKRKYSFSLYGYCLMPNHPHLVGEIEKKENLSKFMQCLTRSYSAYFNHKYDKVGHLWQGRFDNRIVMKDVYVVNCINYVELNPVRAGLVKLPHEYKWSSYVERVLRLNLSSNLLDPLAL